MNKEVDDGIKELFNLIDTRHAEFDKWLVGQQENLRKFSKIQQDIKSKHKSQICQLKEEQSNIQRNIQKAQADEKQYAVKERQNKDLQDRLNTEIKEIPQNFDLYKAKIYLLETKADRLRSFNNNSNEEMKKTQSALQAYETLFGVSFEAGRNTTTINFTGQKSKVILAETDGKYKFVEFPNQINKDQKEIIAKYNNDKNLYDFISTIRESLIH